MDRECHYDYYTELGLPVFSSKGTVAKRIQLLLLGYEQDSPKYNTIVRIGEILGDDAGKSRYDLLLQLCEGDLYSNLSIKANREKVRYEKSIQEAIDRGRKLLGPDKPFDVTTSQNDNIGNDIQSRYAKLLSKYPSGQDRDKMDNIEITIDGKVEMMVQMTNNEGNVEEVKRKFSVLQPDNGQESIPNGIVRGDVTMGMGDMRYFSGDAAEKECTKQGNDMKLFNNEEDAETFIDKFPGTDRKEKIQNFVRLFLGVDSAGTLKKPGFWDARGADRSTVGSSVSAILSKVSRNGGDYGPSWDNNDADMYMHNPKIAQLVIVSEGC